MKPSDKQARNMLNNNTHNESTQHGKLCDTLQIPPGLGFSVMGDSISTLAGCIPATWRCHYEGEISVPGVQNADNTWWGQVIHHFGGHLVANSSFSGSCVEGFGFPAGCSQQRAQALVGKAGEVPDVVLVFMGINDYGWGGAKNQVMGGSVSRSANASEIGGQQPVRLTVGRDALERFAGAYSAMLDNIHAGAPDARVWCLTLPGAFTEGKKNKPSHFIYHARGVALDAYNQAIRDCAHTHGAHVADIRAFGADYESVDNTHPTARGMKQIAGMVCAQMEGMPARVDACAKSYPQLTDMPASREWCNRATCEGCEHSPLTSVAWSVACMKEQAY